MTLWPGTNDVTVGGHICNSLEPGPEDEDVAQELCHVEADDEDNDGLVEGGFSVVHDLRDLIGRLLGRSPNESNNIEDSCMRGYLHTVVHVKERGREIGPLEAQRVLLGCNSIEI